MNAIVRVLATATLFIGANANADLYTGHIASLEWKSHSSDAVLVVSVDSRSSDPPTVRLVDVFSRPGDSLRNAESVAKSWKAPRPTDYEKASSDRKGWRPDGDWLLFVRRWENRAPTIDHVVFLENPLQASWMSAVTAQGRLLVERQAIIDVVRGRLGNGEPITAHERLARSLVDKGERQPRDWSRAEPNSETVGTWLGGFHIPVDISAWDAPDDVRSFDEDLWIRRIIVPADVSYRDQVLAYWTNGWNRKVGSPSHSNPDYPVFALVNYPGERTEQLLVRMSHVDAYKSDAKVALQYLRFYEPEFDEQDRRLVGSWVLTAKTERFQLDLLNDYELIVERRPIPFPNSSKDERVWFAKGRWNLHRGKLYLMANRLRLSTMDRFMHQAARLPALEGLAVINVASDAITLENGRVLSRTPRPIENVDSE